MTESPLFRIDIQEAFFMSKTRIIKAGIMIGVLATTQISPVFSAHPALTALSARAATLSTTYTDSQGVIYSLDSVTQTATASSYSGTGVKLVIPDFVSSDGLNYPVTSIGTYAFSNAGLQSVTIGDNVTDINTSAFQTTTVFPNYYKTSLTSLVLGKSVQTIKTDAFAGNALTAVDFPPSVSKISTRAFANNFITELSFGANVTDVMSKAFQSNQLTTIKFAPNAQTLVGSAAFSGSPVLSLTLGTGVVLADDTFNKISPLFGQFSDMPLTGVRTISVSPDGSIQKSWLVSELAPIPPEETADETVSSLQETDNQPDIPSVSIDDNEKSGDISQELSLPSSVVEDNLIKTTTALVDGAKVETKSSIKPLQQISPQLLVNPTSKEKAVKIFTDKAVSKAGPTIGTANISRSAENTSLKIQTSQNESDQSVPTLKARSSKQSNWLWTAIPALISGFLFGKFLSIFPKRK